MRQMQGSPTLSHSRLLQRSCGDAVRSSLRTAAGLRAASCRLTKAPLPSATSAAGCAPDSAGVAAVLKAVEPTSPAALAHLHAASLQREAAKRCIALLKTAAQAAGGLKDRADSIQAWRCHLDDVRRALRLATTVGCVAGSTAETAKPSSGVSLPHGLIRHTVS
jgi:hypothetical protein